MGIARIKKRLAVTSGIVIILIGMAGVIFSQAQTNKEIKDIKYFGVNYRDPFSSFLPEEKIVERVEKINPPDLKLQGIVWGGDKPRAIINNTVLGKGDKIQGAEIIDVKKEGVDFIYKDQQFILERSGLIKLKNETEEK